MIKIFAFFLFALALAQVNGQTLPQLSDACLDLLNSAALAEHNKYRSVPLVIDPTIRSYSQSNAQNMATLNAFNFGTQPYPYAIAIGSSSSSSVTYVSPADCTAAGVRLVSALYSTNTSSYSTKFIGNNNYKSVGFGLGLYKTSSTSTKAYFSANYATVAYTGSTSAPATFAPTTAGPAGATTTTASLNTTLNKPSASCLAAFRKGMNDQHNIFRTWHQVANVSQNSTINGVAQAYAESLAARNAFEHSVGSGYGENLAWMNDYRYSTSVDADCETVGKKMCQSWYDEINFYSFSLNAAVNATSVVGHFTQVVWKTSTLAGFGLGLGKSGSNTLFFGVANYAPPGNWVGQNAANVLPKL